MELKEKAKKYFDEYVADKVYYLTEKDKYVNVNAINSFKNDKKVLFIRKWIDKCDINFPDNWDYDIQIVQDKIEAIEKPKKTKKV